MEPVLYLSLIHISMYINKQPNILIVIKYIIIFCVLNILLIIISPLFSNISFSFFLKFFIILTYIYLLKKYIPIKIIRSSYISIKFPHSLYSKNINSSCLIYFLYSSKLSSKKSLQFLI